MSRSLQRRQRPASLQLLSNYGSAGTENGPFSRQTHGVSEIRSPSPGTTTFPTAVATTRAHSPARSITTTSRSRIESARETVFVTITTTRRGYAEDEDEDEDKTPSPTRSVLFPAAPQTVRITISDIPRSTSALSSSTTAGAGSAQTQIGNRKPGPSPALSQTARVGLEVLGAICKSVLTGTHSEHTRQALTSLSWSGLATDHRDCCMEEKFVEEIGHATRFGRS